MGYCLGPFLGQFIIPRFGKPTLFLVVFLGLSFFLMLSLLLPDVRPDPLHIREYKKDLLRKDHLILALLTFLSSLHIGAERACLSLFLRENIGENVVGIVFLSVGITLVIFIFLTGLLTEKRRNLRIFFLLGLLLSGSFNIAMLWVTGLPSVLIVRIIHVIGDSIFLIAQRIAISNLSQIFKVGGSLGVMDLTLNLGIVVGAFLSGLAPNYTFPFLYTGFCSLFGVILIFLLRPRFEQVLPTRVEVPL